MRGEVPIEREGSHPLVVDQMHLHSREGEPLEKRRRLLPKNGTGGNVLLKAAALPEADGKGCYTLLGGEEQLAELDHHDNRGWDERRRQHAERLTVNRGIGGAARGTETVDVLPVE